MIFDKIQIKNFKGISKLELNDLGKINFFVGKNNGGKSSILDAIYILSQQGDPRCIQELFKVRNTIIRKGEDLKFIFPKGNINLDPEVNGTLRELYFATRLRAHSGDHIEGQVVSVSKNQLPINGILLLSGQGKNHNPFDLDEWKDSKGVELSSSTIVINENSDISTHHTPFKLNFGSRYSPYPVFYVPSSPTYNYINEQAKEAAKKKQKGKVIEILKTVDGTINDYEVIGNEVFLDIDGWEEMALLNSMGEGFIKLFGILLAIINSENGICLIDEIENGLHHSVLENIWQHILITANDYNVQLFITTHNAEILEAITKVISNDQKESLRVHRIEKSKENKHLALSYDFDGLVRMIENGNEIRGW